MPRHFIGTALAASLLLSLASPAARAVDTDMAISTIAIDFGQVSPGSTAQASVTLTNTGGDPFGPINIFGGAPPTAEFNASQNCQATVLPAGGSCQVNYSFSPGSSGVFNDASSFTISETNSQSDGEDFNVSLTGVGRCVGRLCGVINLCLLNPFLCDDLPVLEPAPVTPAAFSVAPTSLDFGPVGVGTTATLEVVVTNVGGSTATPNFAGGAPNDPTNFGGSQDCAGVPLAPGASCRFTYTFEPSANGAFSSSTTIGIDAENFGITFTGVGVPSVSVAPTSLDFGHVLLGTTAALEVVVTNIAGSPINPNYAGGAPTDPTNFGGSQNCAGVPLAPGQSCQFTYTFTPSATGVFTTSTTIDVDGTNFPISLTGVGLDPNTLTFSHELAGAATLKGDGFKARSAYSLQLNLDVAALTFFAKDSDGTFFAGQVAPKGKSGKKFSLFLDDTSSDALAAKVAARAAAASGLAAGTRLENSSTLTLKVRDDGSAALKIKSEAFTSGIGAVAFKAKLAGAAIETK